MSHEIRTPMNGIIGIIGMLTLAENKLEANSPAMQYITKADELSDHLIALINDILDMSRIEVGKVELEQGVFSLRALGNRLYDMFAKNLDSRGIRYEVNFEGVTVDYVCGDELRISQVIINFLSNAVKFTSEGEIIVTFRQMMLQNGVADFMIRVHDTGIGMEPEFINRIFRPFEQETIETSRLYGGTGLGMAITDQLVKLMGGEIVVESQPQKGSDFSVFLHLPIAEKPAALPAEQQQSIPPFRQRTNARRQSGANYCKWCIQRQYLCTCLSGEADRRKGEGAAGQHAARTRAFRITELYADRGFRSQTIRIDGCGGLG